MRGTLRAVEQSLIEQLTPWIASGVIAIAGILIGRRIESRSAHAAWLRDQRLRAYAEAVAASREFRSKVAEMYHSPSRDSGEVVLSAANQIGNRLSMIDLVGPQRVASAAGDLWDAHRRLAQLLLDADSGLEPDPYSRVSLDETNEGNASVAAERQLIEVAAAEITWISGRSRVLGERFRVWLGG